jgi:hypothetical protein
VFAVVFGGLGWAFMAAADSRGISLDEERERLRVVGG